MNERHWVVASSYVRKVGDKVTSLTVCAPNDLNELCAQLTFSIKDNSMIRVKLGIEEVAGLAESLTPAGKWSCFHTFDNGTGKTETKMSYSNLFINAERGSQKIALKLSENELASLKMTLETLYQAIILHRIRSSSTSL
ncbi:MAG: hypothetical protein NTU61_02800 [Candidatus Altiarchaeota archaeon]|nr:hypothetical protein [Candidatus Altiarchaeota archaeon]